MAIRRFGNFQPITDVVDRDDGKYVGLRLGVTTYDESDNYSISYLEVGMRSDHLDRALSSIVDSSVDRGKQSVSTPHEYDSHLVVPRTVDTVSAELTPAETVQTPAEKPMAVVA